MERKAKTVTEISMNGKAARTGKEMVLRGRGRDAGAEAEKGRGSVRRNEGESRIEIMDMKEVGNVVGTATETGSAFAKARFDCCACL